MLGFLHSEFALTRSSFIRSLFGTFLGAFLVVGLAIGLAAPVSGWAKTPPPLVTDSTVSLADMPKQANETYTLILQGGPFAYDKDGTVFGNRERILPAQKRGFYREYTVKTPYARNRGAKRIICGGSQPTTPEACYYTEDHYATFKRIVK